MRNLKDTMFRAALATSYAGLALCAVAGAALIGCDDLLANDETFQNFTCSVVPYYVADCTQPEVQARVRSVLTDGIVEAELRCTGIAFGDPGKFVSVVYKAQKLQDGSCLARVDLFGSAAPNPGFAQSSGTELQRRSAPGSDTCEVYSYRVPQSISTTSVSNGQVRVVSNFCGATACTMPVAGNCTGLNIEAF